MYICEGISVLRIYVAVTSPYPRDRGVTVGDGGQACVMEEEMEMEMVGLQVKARRSSVGVGVAVV